MFFFNPPTNFYSLNGMQHLDPSVKKLAIFPKSLKHKLSTMEILQF